MSYKSTVSLLPTIPDQAGGEDLFAQIFKYANQRFQTLAWSVDDALNLVNSEDANERSEVLIWNAKTRLEQELQRIIDEAPNYIWMNYPTKRAPQYTDLVDNLPQDGEWAKRDLEQIYIMAIHHTVSWNHTVSNYANALGIANYHINKNGWIGAGYHYLVAPDGEIMKLNSLDSKTFHIGSVNAPGDENQFAIGVALGGDFRNQPPSEPQIFSAASLYSWLGHDLKKDLELIPHKRAPGASTICPGYEIDSWLKRISGKNELV